MLNALTRSIHATHYRSASGLVQRPQLALPERPAKGDYAATMDIQIFIIMFF